MTRGKNFLIIPTDGKEPLLIKSTDYDDDNEMVRYRDAIYDMATGLYIVGLKAMNNGNGHWEKCGCTSVHCTSDEMMRYATNNIKFMAMVNKLRSTIGYANQPKINIVDKEMNLFNM